MPAHIARDRLEQTRAIFVIALQPRNLISDGHPICCKVVFRDRDVDDDAKAGRDAQEVLESVLDESCVP